MGRPSGARGDYNGRYRECKRCRGFRVVASPLKYLIYQGTATTRPTRGGTLRATGRLKCRHRFGEVAAMHVMNIERSEEHTSELQSLMRISYAVFCLKKKKTTNKLRDQRCTLTLQNNTKS